MLPLALTRMTARRLSLLIAAVGYGAGLRHAAAEPSLAIASTNLEVEADPTCTTRAALIERVRARLPRVRLVDDGSGLSIRAKISTAPSGVVTGDVTLVSPGTKPSVRHVPARSCAEAVDAVALIIAVTLDPSSATKSLNASTDEAGTPAAAGGSAIDSTAGDGTSTSKSTPSAPTAEAPRATDIPVPASPGAAERTRVTFGVQIATEALVGVAPGVMPGVSLFTIAGLDRPSAWAPALAFGLHHDWRTAVVEEGGTASFALDLLGLDVCPLRFRVSVIEARPCGSLLVGRFTARGTDTLNAADESARPFWAVGGAALLTADLVWRLQAFSRFTIAANLVRDSFEFNPATFHTVPPLSASASVGVGLHW